MIVGIAAALGNSPILAKDLATCRVYSSMGHLISFFPVVNFWGRKKRVIGQDNQIFAFTVTVQGGGTSLRGSRLQIAMMRFQRKAMRFNHAKAFTVFIPSVTS